ncbi:YwdI family protein [Oceanobacillus kapialis]|uniref:YwdI family protein n=1 Tax=Oceanobacillus kapialis TaxID=481353 RepID=UPI0038510B67
MAVTNETILQKMMKELEQAKANKYEDNVVQKHVQNVRLLCDLFLDDAEEPLVESSPKVAQVEDFSVAEMKAMMGQDPQETRENKTRKQQNTLEEEDGNGDSIFDF